MDFLNQLIGEVQATTTTRGLAQVVIDLPGTAQTRGRCSADIAVAVAVADAYKHALSVYECE